MSIRKNCKYFPVWMIVVFSIQLTASSTAYAGFNTKRTLEVGRVVNTFDIWLLTITGDNGQKVVDLTGIGGRELINFGDRIEVEIDGFSTAQTGDYQPALSPSGQRAKVILAKGEISLRIFKSTFSPLVGAGYGLEKVDLPYLISAETAEKDESGQVADGLVLRRGTDARPNVSLQLQYQNRKNDFFMKLRAIHSLARKSQHQEINFSAYSLLTKTLLMGLQFRMYVADESVTGAPGFTMMGYGFSLGFKIDG